MLAAATPPDKGGAAKALKQSNLALTRVAELEARINELSGELAAIKEVKQEPQHDHMWYKARFKKMDLDIKKIDEVCAVSRDSIQEQSSTRNQFSEDLLSARENMQDRLSHLEKTHDHQKADLALLTKQFDLIGEKFDDNEVELKLQAELIKAGQSKQPTTGSSLRFF